MIATPLRLEPDGAAAGATSPVDPRFPVGTDWGAGEVGLWWLGQAGFALRHAGTLVLIDPYLSDSLAEKYRGRRYPHVRLVPPPVDPEQVACAAVLCTHGHTDHLDPVTLTALHRAGRPAVVVPAAETDLALARGASPERLIGMVAGEVSEPVPGLRVAAIPSAHEELVLDEHGRHRHLGYLVSLGEVTVYHSGDCVPYPGQADQVRAAAGRLGRTVDVALLPVNGRDAERAGNGVPGNFHVEEAAQLCLEAGIPTLIGHHIGLFDFNTVAPQEVQRRLEALLHAPRWLLPELGLRYRLSRTEVAA